MVRSNDEAQKRTAHTTLDDEERLYVSACLPASQPVLPLWKN